MPRFRSVTAVLAIALAAPALAQTPDQYLNPAQWEALRSAGVYSRQRDMFTAAERASFPSSHRHLLNALPNKHAGFAINATGRQIAAYYPEWAVYARSYYPKDIPVSNLTHIYCVHRDLRLESGVRAHPTGGDPGDGRRVRQ